MDSLMADLSPRELADAVTPLFILDRRHQREALDALVRRCERHEAALLNIARRKFTGTWQQVAEQYEREAREALDA